MLPSKPQISMPVQGESILQSIDHCNKWVPGSATAVFQCEWQSWPINSITCCTIEHTQGARTRNAGVGAYSDNPGWDQKYLLADAALLRATQDWLDRYAEQANQRRCSSGGTSDSAGTAPVVDVNVRPTTEANTTNSMNATTVSIDDLDSWIKIAMATTKINSMCDTVREHLVNERQGSQKSLALDNEWDTKKNNR